MKQSFAFVQHWIGWTGALVFLYWLHTFGWPGVIAAAALTGLVIAATVDSAVIVLETIEQMLEREKEQADE